MDGTTAPAVHGALGDIDRPTASGAETDLILIGDLTMGAIHHGIDSIIESIETRHAVVNSRHVSTRGDIVGGENHLAVTGDNDLVDGSEVGVAQVLGGVLPAQRGRKCVVSSRGHGEVLGSLGRIAIDIIRHEVEHAFGIIRVFDVFNQEVVVVGATPTPVEVEHVIVVIAVADKGMAILSTGRVTGVQNRPSHIERFLQEVHPCRHGGRLINDISGAGIAEIVGNGGRNPVGVTTTTFLDITTVVHVDGDTAMEANLCNSIAFSGTVAVGIGIQHIIPVVGGIAEVGGNHTILGVDVGM